MKFTEEYKELLGRFLDDETDFNFNELNRLVHQMFLDSGSLDHLTDTHTGVIEYLAGALAPSTCAAFVARANKFIVHAIKAYFLYYHTSTEALVRKNRELAEQLEYRSRTEDALKQAKETAEELSRNKTEILAVMSHEIRSPMNGLMGITQILMDTPLNEEQTEYIQIIKQSGESLLKIINDLLDLSKIEAGKMALEQTAFDLGVIMGEVYDLLAVNSDQKGLDLLYHIEPDVPIIIETDTHRFRQILINLITNGIKFTDAGEIEINVKAIQTGTEHYKLQFSVRDTGIGIPADKLDQLFIPFSQIGSSHSQGTGLGLAICRKLVEMMGGSIWVESTPGTGSIFFFTLKVIIKKQWKRYGEIYPGDEFKGKSLLVFDDNLAKLRVIRSQCEFWGMQVDTFSTFEQALSAVCTNHYDLAILDSTVPGRDGIDLARLIKADERTKDLPLIIYTTTRGLPQDKKQDIKLFAAVMERPVKYALLYKIMNGIFDK